MLCGLTSRVAKGVDLYYPWESALGTRIDVQRLDLDRPRIHLIKIWYTIQVKEYYTVGNIMDIRGICRVVLIHKHESQT